MRERVCIVNVLTFCRINSHSVELKLPANREALSDLHNVNVRESFLSWLFFALDSVHAPQSESQCTEVVMVSNSNQLNDT